MQIRTKYFGQIPYESGDVIFFEGGLFGFEQEKQFLLLPFEGGNGMLVCFQSIATPELAFVAMNPFALKPDYAPLLQKEELKLLKVQESQELSFYMLCVVRNPVSQSTVNLKCPVAVNEDTNAAIQVILDDSAYELRHRLSEFQEREAALC